MRQASFADQFYPEDKKELLLMLNSFIEKKPRFDYTNIMKKYSFSKMTDETLKIYQGVLERN